MTAVPVSMVKEYRYGRKLTWQWQQLGGSHGGRRWLSGRLGRGHPRVRILRVRTGGSVGGRGRLQDRGLSRVRVMRHATSRGSLRSIRLSRRQVRRVNVHVWRGVIHAADGMGRRVVALTDGGGHGIIRRAASSEISRRRRSAVVVESSGGTRETGARARSVRAGDGRVRVGGPVGRLRGRRQAQGREFVTGQQRPFSSVRVVVRNFSRTSDVDLRDRWELQFFGWSENRLEKW